MVMAMGNYEIAPNPSPEENARLIKEANLRALIVERGYAETHVKIAEAEGNTARAGAYKQTIKDIDAALSEAGVDAEPRANPVRK